MEDLILTGGSGKSQQYMNMIHGCAHVVCDDFAGSLTSMTWRIIVTDPHLATAEIEFERWPLLHLFSFVNKSASFFPLPIGYSLQVCQNVFFGTFGS